MADVRLDESDPGRWVVDLSRWGDGVINLVDKRRRLVAELMVDDQEVICTLAPRVLAALALVDGEDRAGPRGEITPP